MANLWTYVPPLLPHPPKLDDFADSVFSKFYFPIDHYAESAQSYGADFSTNAGTYSALPLLVNGKTEAAEEALVCARANSQKAINMLGALPNGMQGFDKHGHQRVTFVP